MRNRIIKYVVILAAALLPAAVSCQAQKNAPRIKFEDPSHDFGTIAEADGPVTHTFVFTNTGSSPVVIEQVRSDCGCTSPKYDRQPVKPKEKGYVEVLMDPKNFAGNIKKCVTVIVGNGRESSRNLLCVTANVVPRPRTVEEDYPIALEGGVRAASLHAPFRYMQNNTSKTVGIDIVNTSGKTVNIKAENATGSGLLVIEMPPSLKTGEKGEIRLTYDLTGPDVVYGMVSDRIYISVDGREAALPINANAIATDDFSKTNPDNMASAHISPVFHNFRDAKPGDRLTTEFTISNTGQGPLIIRNISLRRNTSTSLEEGTVVEPGKNVRFSVTMDIPNDASGVVSGGFSIIANDPDRPFRDVRTAAEVNCLRSK